MSEPRVLSQAEVQEIASMLAESPEGPLGCYRNEALSNLIATCRYLAEAMEAVRIGSKYGCSNCHSTFVEADEALKEWRGE